MPIAAFIILAAAVALGSTLAVFYLNAPTAAAPWPLTALHGIVGLLGLSLLGLSLRGPPRGTDHGVASFAPTAAVLIALAALAGVCVLLTHRRKRRAAGTLIGMHATLAVAGFVVFAAYLFA